MGHVTLTHRSKTIQFITAVLLFFSALHTSGQDSTSSALTVKPLAWEQRYPPEVVKRRLRNMSFIQAGSYSLAMIGLYKAWYADYPHSKFHLFNDINEWKGMDKIGHVYSAYAEAKASMELWRVTGVDKKKRIWLGAMSAFAYQTSIETLDGFSKEWGWSWGDVGANLLGSGLFLSQQLAWDEQRLQLKWSFHKKTYSDAGLNARSDKLFGRSSAERFLKDYNGQTYWLSANIRSFLPQSNVPKWLNIAFGTGAEGMFGGYTNVAAEDGVVNFDRRDIKRYRQWYLAPDIDLTKIPTNKKSVKVILDILNIWKFPLPALEYGNGKIKGHWLAF